MRFSAILTGVCVCLGVLACTNAFSQSAQQTPAQVKLDEDLKRIQAIGIKGGAGDARCVKCPQACEMTCPANDSKCLAENHRSREKMFATCEAQRKK